ncbi:hypothetical protein V6N13_082606 [Hibiscus sabdariffa]
MMLLLHKHLPLLLHLRMSMLVSIPLMLASMHLRRALRRKRIPCIVWETELSAYHLEWSTHTFGVQGLGGGEEEDDDSIAPS